MSQQTSEKSKQKEIITKIQTTLKAVQRTVEIAKIKKKKGHGRLDKNKQYEIKVNKWLKHQRERLCLKETKIIHCTDNWYL